MSGQRRRYGCEARDEMLHAKNPERTNRVDLAVSKREHSNFVNSW